MSFILDALRKIEEKRRTGEAPDLMTVHVEEKEEKKRPLIIYLLVTVLIFNAVMFTVLLLRPRDESTVQKTATETVQTAEPAAEHVNAAETATNTEPSPGKEENAAKEQPGTVTAKKEVQPAEQAPLPLAPSPGELKELKRTIAGERLTAEPGLPAAGAKHGKESTAVSQSTVPDMDSLPSTVKDGLPDLTIKGHIYSNDTMSRLVNINGNLLREGETVSEGLTVSEITMSGVVFDYKGQLFSVRAF